ncbi:MAG: uroporphyrinogen-III C-methyltransferase [Tatlockia sp.]|nr:uroporphyrinogen-III C-methyltransferase [Tatlockia sp.]
MANTNEPQAPIASQPKNERLESQSSTVKTPPSKRFVASKMLFSLILAALALITALYSFYSNQQLNSQQAKILNQRLESMAQQQQSSINTLNESAKESKAGLQSQIQTLNSGLQNAIQQGLNQQPDWVLLKARYLLELAQINAHWSKDPQTTLGLMRQADKLLAANSEPQIFAVRQALAKEISQLETVPQLDTAGLLSQLDAAQSELAKLPFKQIIKNSMPTSEEKTTTTWQENLKNSLSHLEKLVVIRRNDKAIQPLLSPFAQKLMSDSIHLNLQEAQWAVMQNNQAVYQLALARARQEIPEIFDESAIATSALLKQLTRLQQENLNRSVKMPEQALTLLNQLIAKKNIQSLDNSTSSQGGKKS